MRKCRFCKTLSEEKIELTKIVYPNKIIPEENRKLMLSFYIHKLGGGYYELHLRNFRTPN